MNRQEIFNKVATHLLTQNSRSMLGDFCSYKSPEGRRCAIGALIPPGHPAETSGNSIGYQFFEAYPDLKKLWDVQDSYDEDFLRGLQRIHDYTEVYEWSLALHNFANQHGLKMPL